jgi:hypothetical protein
LAVTINFISINVNTLDTDATISIGENNQAGWDAHSKNTFGNGMFFGNNLSYNNLNVIPDNDVIDAPINDQDFKPSAQNQSV